MTRFLLLLALAPAIAFGQSTTLRITNASPSLTVPILSGSTPIIDNQGNIYVQCQLQPSLGICVGLSTPVSGTAPTLTFSRSGSGDLQVGASTTLTWATGNAPELCFASASPASADWTGAKSISGGTQAITFASAGTRTLNLKCYNNSGASPLRTVTINVVGAPPPPSGGCNVVKANIADPAQRALFQPDGFTQVTRTWGQLAGGTTYPAFAQGAAYPVGTYTLNNGTYNPATSLRGKYITVPITGNGQNYKFEWIQAKPTAEYNYQPARPTDAIYVTLSTCAGDFRTTSAYSAADPISDPTLIQQCRNQLIDEAGLYYGPTGFGRCPVKAGQTYYLNIVFANPAGGLSTSETGCRNTSTAACETSWDHAPD